jgi:hypothetical protein
VNTVQVGVEIVIDANMAYIMRGGVLRPLAPVVSAPADEEVSRMAKAAKPKKGGKKGGK